MRYIQLIVLLFIVCFTMPRISEAGDAKHNMLSNGRFETWPTDAVEPPGWHTVLTSIIPVPQYKNPKDKKGRTGVYQFKDACGYQWGTVRPWAALYCSKCGHMNTGLEDSGDWYFKNHKYVTRGKGRSGKGVHVNMPETVGNVQGVRVISDLLHAEPDAVYEISFDAVSQGPHLRVFVEGFREMKRDKKAQKWAATLAEKSNPFKQKYRLKRVFRKHVNADIPHQWKRFTYQFAPPKRYQFDRMFVTLYAYLPGEATFDNIVLRKLSAREASSYRAQHDGPKDQRLR